MAQTVTCCPPDLFCCFLQLNSVLLTNCSAMFISLHPIIYDYQLPPWMHIFIHAAKSCSPLIDFYLYTSDTAAVDSYTAAKAPNSNFHMRPMSFVKLAAAVRKVLGTSEDSECGEVSTEGLVNILKAPGQSKINVSLLCRVVLCQVWYSMVWQGIV